MDTVSKDLVSSGSSRLAGQGLPAQGTGSNAAAETWAQALDCLKLRVSREAFDTWLAPTRGVELNQDSITVEVPNSFFAEWIGQHYSAEIATALRAVARNRLAVSYRARDVADAARLRVRSYSSASGSSRSGHDPRNPKPENGRLQARYTFANFVVGESSRLAYAAARNVAERPGSAYNPLFLYGGAGLGKTHLLQAIGNHAIQTHRNLKVYYAAAETLFLELIHAIQKGTRLEFKSKYRSLDLLLLDDIHYLVGKERLQEEIFHMFNHLHDAGSQVAFTSDRPPRDIPTLQERLASRLGSGLVVDIQPPDLETRIAILQQKAAQQERELPHEVAHYVAARVRTSVRDLEGCLTRILAMASLSASPVTLALAEAALRDLVAQQQPITQDAIVEAVASTYGVSVADIKGRSRTKQLALARQVTMYLLRANTTLSLKEIGRCLGNKDHTTVMHAIDKVEQLRALDPAFAHQLDQLTSRIAR